MTQPVPGKPQVTPFEPEHTNSRRDPEERLVETEAEAKEKAHDKTLADSFPTSDPPSTIPDPSGDAALPENADALLEDALLADLPDGSWAALSIGDQQVVGTGTTRAEATEDARGKGHTEISLVRIGENPADVPPALAS